MASLVNKLKPPFYVAIINDGENIKTFDDGISPTDEMVSIAPHQPGFLGLETTWDKQGRWVTVSYWADIDSEKAWEHKGDNRIRKQFGGQALKETCAIRVSQINYKIRSIKELRAGILAITKSSMSASIGALVFSAFPMIAELLGRESVR